MKNRIHRLVPATLVVACALAAPAAQCSAGEAPAEMAFESEPMESLIDGGVR